MITGIIAISRNYAIGKDGKLPWHYPADLKFFKETTTGNTIVMGRTTWTSIGRPLPNRLNIVLSRGGSIEPQPGVIRLRSKQEVLSAAEYLKGDVFIIGGSKTYQTFADVIDKWIVTEIPETVENADVFMPKDFLANFGHQNELVLDGGLKVRTYERA